MILLNKEQANKCRVTIEEPTLVLNPVKIGDDQYALPDDYEAEVKKILKLSEVIKKDYYIDELNDEITNYINEGD